MDAEYAAALRRILTRAMEDVRQTQAAIEAAFIMRSLERIGDHARNIARHVGFIGGYLDPTSTGVLPAGLLMPDGRLQDRTD
jgi:phosphate transport system protein